MNTGEQSRTRACDIAIFVALLSTAVALGGALAHLLELPNKIGLPREQYFTVQAIYRGWNLLAFVLLIELASILSLMGLARRDARVLRPAVAALLCLIAAQALFWLFTYPANVATANWTVMPPDWEQLRSQWEYSHAVGALLQLGAMIALILAAIARARSPSTPSPPP